MPYRYQNKNTEIIANAINTELNQLTEPYPDGPFTFSQICNMSS